MPRLLVLGCCLRQATLSKPGNRCCRLQKVCTRYQINELPCLFRQNYLLLVCTFYSSADESITAAVVLAANILVALPVVVALVVASIIKLKGDG